MYNESFLRRPTPRCALRTLKGEDTLLGDARHIRENRDLLDFLGGAAAWRDIRITTRRHAGDSQ